MGLSSGNSLKKVTVAYTPRQLSGTFDIPYSEVREALRSETLRAFRAGRATLIRHDDAISWVEWFIHLQNWQDTNEDDEDIVGDTLRSLRTARKKPKAR